MSAEEIAALIDGYNTLRMRHDEARMKALQAKTKVAAAEIRRKNATVKLDERFRNRPLTARDETLEAARAESAFRSATAEHAAAISAETAAHEEMTRAWDALVSVA